MQLVLLIEVRSTLVEITVFFSFLNMFIKTFEHFCSLSISVLGLPLLLFTNLKSTFL